MVKKSKAQLDADIASALATKLPASYFHRSMSGNLISHDTNPGPQITCPKCKILRFGSDFVTTSGRPICRYCAAPKARRSHSKVKRSSKSKSKPPLRVAYRLQLAPSEVSALAFARGRYAWPDMLSAHVSDGGLVAFTEPEMWQWCDDVDSDAEGGHSPFPLASPAFAKKLQNFYDERV